MAQRRTDTHSKSSGSDTSRHSSSRRRNLRSRCLHVGCMLLPVHPLVRCLHTKRKRVRNHMCIPDKLKPHRDHHQLPALPL